MKKIILMLMLTFSATLFAQRDFPGELIELLEGKELKVKPIDESLRKYGYRGFYTDPEMKKTYKRKGVNTKYEALLGTVFKVISYKPSYSDYIITLENPEIGTLYYLYKTNQEHNFVFEVIGGLKFPEGYFCKELVRKRDWNSYEVKYDYTVHTPCTEDICVWKDDKGVYSLHLLITDSSPTRESGLKGLKLYFKEGKELSFPDAEVVIEPSMGDYNYKVEIPLSKDQLQFLKQNSMIKKVIGTHEKEIKNGDLILEYIKCLVK